MRLPGCIASILTAAACGGARPEAKEAPRIEAEVDAPPPASLAVARSKARKDWPCGIDAMVGTKNALTEIAITYGGPETCLLPVDVHADGIIGCPTRFTLTRLDRDAVTEVTYTYDVGDHLVRVDHADGTTHYTWDGDTLVSRTNANRGLTSTTYRYVESNGIVELVRDTDAGPAPELLVRFDRAKLIALEIPAFNRVDTVVWEDERIRRIDSVGTGYKAFQRPIYDCE